MNKLRVLKQIINDIPSLSKRFHEGTSIRALSSTIGLEDWPVEWRRIHFKSYPRLKQIVLKRLRYNRNSLFRVIEGRRSNRDFKSYKVSKDEVAKLLLFSAGITFKSDNGWDQSRRAYPSAGARYPIEIYPVILRARDLEVGLYHYNVKLHSLELLLAQKLERDLLHMTGQEYIEAASLVFIITAVVGRSKIKYGERAYRHCLLEAGHVAQNIYLVSTALRLKCCAVGGFVDKEINDLLDIDDDNEFAVYLLIIGK